MRQSLPHLVPPLGSLLGRHVTDAHPRSVIEFHDPRQLSRQLIAVRRTHRPTPYAAAPPSWPFGEATATSWDTPATTGPLSRGFVAETGERALQRPRARSRAR